MPNKEGAVLSKANLSKNVKKNIKLSYIIKGISIFNSFYLTRLTYDFLNNNSIYGIWLTILTILSWINFFDIGLGNGLRNNLTESIAEKDDKSSKIYISTTYFFMGIIVIILLFLYFIASNYINWISIFNVKIIENKQLKLLMDVVISLYLLRFLLLLINYIFYSFQKSALPSIIDLVSSIMFLLLIIILHNFKVSSLIFLGTTYSLIYSIVPIIVTIYFFLFMYPNLRPRIRYIKIKYVSKLMGVGLKFFIIQIFSMIIFTTDNMIITKVLGPQYVPQYQITYKLFSIFNMIFSIIMTSLWSAFTYSYKNKDYNWIVKVIKKVFFIFLFLVLGVLLMVILFKYILQLWMGNRIEVNWLLVINMAIYTIITMWFSIFAYLSNGIGDLNLQLITYVIAGIINIPLSIYFSVNMKFGTAGVVMASNMCLLIYAILGPIRIYRLFRNNLNNN